MSRARLRVNPHSIVAWMSRNSLLEAGAKSEGEVTATGVTSPSHGEKVPLALVDNPSSDGITIKICYGVDVLLHQPALHPIFSYCVG